MVVGAGAVHESGDNSVAAHVRVELLFLRWALRTPFAAGTALTTRITLTAGTATSGVAHPAGTTHPAGAASALWWPHLFQLL